MDGDNFTAWLWKTSEAIRERAASLGVYQDGRNWALAAFDCNYDPKAAAHAWLKLQLSTTPPPFRPLAGEKNP
jgi:hypothetical protein